MEPLGLSASIIAILELTGKVLKYLNDIKEASQERAEVAIEAASVYSLLTTLRYRDEKAKLGDPWYTATRNLGVENGALDQYRSALERLASHLQPQHGLKKLEKRLIWTFDKKEVANILSKIERLKSLVSLALQNDLFAITEATKADVNLLGEGVLELRLNHLSEKRQNIAKWLSPLDFKSRQHDILLKRQEGTVEWVLVSPTFTEWNMGGLRTLWCHGIPGSGKTVLTSVVVNHLQTIYNGKDVAVACIYCDYKARVEQTALNLVSSLLKQLIQNCPVLSDNISQLYDKHRSRQPAFTREELAIVLRTEITRYSKVFIIIDALDECTNDESARTIVLQELRSLPENVKVMVTSRNDPMIGREFVKAQSIEIVASDADIKLYVIGRILHANRLAIHVKADPSFQDTIVCAIITRAKGMFLLAHLHMDSLATKNNRKDLRMALENLPDSVNDTYDEAMTRIHSQNTDDRQLADKVLLWVAYTFRQLSIMELQHAVTVEESSTDTDLEALTDQEILISVCAGLVVIDDESNVVRLVHYTAQDYFNCTQKMHYPNAQKIIAAACLTYISFKEFVNTNAKLTHSADWKERYKDRRAKHKHLINNHMFLKYAICYWAKHIRGDLEHYFQDALLNLLQNDSRVSSFWDLTTMGQADISLFIGIKPDITGLHVTAYFGLAHTTEALLNRGLPPDALEGDGPTALSYAAAKGPPNDVKLSADWKDVDIEGHRQPPFKLLWLSKVGIRRKFVNRRCTPLSLAAVSGHTEIVKLLLEAGSAADDRFDDYKAPLSLAAVNGHTEIVKLLLEAGSAADDRSDGYKAPLSLAAVNGHTEIVKLLLEAGSAVDDNSDWCGTPLFWAVGRVHLETIKVLVAAGADVNYEVDAGNAPLQVALEGTMDSWYNEGIEIVKALLEGNPNFHALDDQNQTYIEMARSRGMDESIIQLLEEAKAKSSILPPENNNVSAG